jgi:hypothetical protein
MVTEERYAYERRERNNSDRYRTRVRGVLLVRHQSNALVVSVWAMNGHNGQVVEGSKMQGRHEGLCQNPDDVVSEFAQVLLSSRERGHS